MSRLKKILSLGLICAVLLSGCAQEPVTEEKVIELLEPVSQGATVEKVLRRNLYDSTTYSAGVYPYTEEYGFEESLNLEYYGSTPGAKVSAGDILAAGNTDSINEQIERAEESLENLAESYDEYKDDAYERLSNLKAERDRVKEAEGEKSASYKLLENDIKKLSNEMSYKKQIYELDYEHSEKNLAALIEKRERYIVRSEIDGTVVSYKTMGYNSSYVSKGTKVVAVSDLSRLKVVCEYINKSTVKRACDVYAIINGKRYEVEHQAIDTATYTQLSQEGTVYSDFLLSGNTGDIAVGDYAVIVLVNKRLEDVISVQKASLNKDATGYYVNVYNNGGTEMRYVKIGYSDGYYTEITEGLSEGEEIVVKEPISVGSGTVTLSTGTIENSFTGNGYMQFPSGYVVENPVKYATTYFGEFFVSQYETVDEDTLICTVRTVGDELELKRTETNLKRLKERLRDLQNTSTTGMSSAQKKQRTKNIEAQKESIAEAEEKLEKILADAETTEIYAGKHGIVTYVGRYSKEQIIGSGATLIEIADVNNCYVVVEDSNNQLNFGNTVDISYQSISTGAQSVAKGTVVLMNNIGVSRDLAAEEIIIQVDPEKLSDMPLTSASQSGWWNRTLYKVTSSIRRMENVIVIPRTAVTDKNGKTYVNVLKDNGDVVATAFISGGSDALNYWVAEGLTEGTVICLK